MRHQRHLTDHFRFRNRHLYSASVGLQKKRELYSVHAATLQVQGLGLVRLTCGSGVPQAYHSLYQELKREREREFNLSIQPALAYEDTSMLESSAKVRMAAKQ